MTRITIIGTGAMGTAIGDALTSGGADVTRLSHEQTGSSAIVGDIVVLAVPHPAVAGILDAYRDQFEGKVVVDITNPINFETFDSPWCRRAAQRPPRSRPPFPARRC